MKCSALLNMPSPPHIWPRRHISSSWPVADVGTPVNARLRADNDLLRRHLRPMPDTPAPGTAARPVGALNDLQLMDLLDRSSRPSWRMKEAETGEMCLRYLVGTGNPTVRLNVESVRSFANCVANLSRR